MVGGLAEAEPRKAESDLVAAKGDGRAHVDGGPAAQLLEAEVREGARARSVAAHAAVSGEHRRLE